ncbi:MAG: ribonuclease J [Myxococcota bacterium]
MTHRLRFIPLGGLSEVGMNCAAMAVDDASIAIDCGVGFTDESGADMMHPDFSWLHDRANNLCAVVVTHGHEDHIGGLPYFLKRSRVPVYAPPYAAALIEDRLAEHRIEGVDVRVTEVGRPFEIGPFRIERFAVHHSIADATGLILETPVGTIVHTGDFKIESEPSPGQRFDRDRLERAAQQGVRLLLSDSTGADVDGSAGLESTAASGIRTCVAAAPERVLIATFSSNVFRLRAAFETARAHGRKVCLLGMSVQKHTEVARQLSYVSKVDSLLVSIEEAATLPRDRVMIVAGGTQGEPGASLTRLARDEHTHLRLDAGDTVVFSSRIIPGNERAVFDVIDRFERRGIRVITRRSHPEVHASGHGSRDEQRAMIDLVRPEAFVPVHGTHHHRQRHAELARDAGISEIELIGNGDVLEVTRDRLEVTDHVRVGRVYVERMVPLAPGVMEDRRAMAAGGLVTILVSTDGDRVGRSLRVISEAVVGHGERPALERRIAAHLRSRLANLDTDDVEHAEEVIGEAARGFLFHVFRKKPLLRIILRDDS